MNKTIVIMSPTVNRAIYEWKAFLSRWSTIIKSASRTSLCVELLSGHKIYFKGETEGRRSLLGLHADIINVDEFVIPQESEEWVNFADDLIPVIDEAENEDIVKTIIEAKKVTE